MVMCFNKHNVNLKFTVFDMYVVDPFPLLILPAGATAFSFSFFSPGAGPIHLDDVMCTGTENRLTDCTYTSVHNCIHFEDAGVRCQPMRELVWLCDYTEFSIHTKKE